MIIKLMKQLGTGWRQASAAGAMHVAVMAALLLIPELAFAQDLTGGAFGGITNFIKSVAQLLIYEWGYYIGTITLAIQGYRWKTGHINLMTLGGWALGIFIVFFSPNIVGAIRAGSQGNVG